MNIIEILDLVSDFWMVFICTAAFIGVLVYLIREIFKGKLDDPEDNEDKLSDVDERAYSCVHNVKILPEYFEGILDGSKPFEFRKNDRGYKPGDCVCLKECIIDDSEEFKKEIYTGRYCFVVIKEIFELGSISPEFSEYVIFTFSILKVVEGEQ